MQISTESGRNQPRFGAGRFPDPTVMNAGISSTDVENGDGSYEVKNVLWSLSGSYYEFAIVIKKSIYGLVVRANVLESVSSDVFRRTGREVAIKVCAKDVLMKNSGVSLENPITEIGAMQDFGEPRHPNIAAQFECCVDDKNIYSVLKFQPGVELFDHILNNGPLNEVAARCMFQQLMLAIFRLQWRDIGHRDISLENIMYDAADHATVLIDFGLCVKLQRDPENNSEYFKIPNAACGKSYYMPPESAWDERSLRLVNPMEGDIWSAGMCLLYALLGFPPIERACEDDVRYRYLTQGRLNELLDHWEASLSPELVDLLQLILQAEPSDRPSVQQILQHSWMQRDGPPCPYQNEISPQELAAALGYSNATTTTTAATLPSLLHPLCHNINPATNNNHNSDINMYHNNREMDCSLDSIDNDDATMTMQEEDGDTSSNDNTIRNMGLNNMNMNMNMSVNTEDCAARESDLLSYRSSVEESSRWSCGTTPTSSYTVPSNAYPTQQTTNNSNNYVTCDTYNGGGSSHINNMSNNNTHNSNSTSKSIPSSSSSSGTGSKQDDHHQQQHHNPYSLCSASIGLDSAGSTSGINSGDSTPTNPTTNTHHQQSYNQYSTSATGSGSHDEHQPHNTHGANAVDTTSYSNNNASTTITNSTNKSSRSSSNTNNNNNNSNSNSPNANFTGYHTRSQSFGKANINYAV